MTTCFSASLDASVGSVVVGEMDTPTSSSKQLFLNQTLSVRSSIPLKKIVDETTPHFDPVTGISNFCGVDDLRNGIAP